MYKKLFKNYSNLIPQGLYIFLNIFLYIYILFSIIFARPFVGLNVAGLLIGELTVAALALISVFIFIVPNTLFQGLNSKIPITFKFIILCFLISALISESNFTDSYTFKTSSYVWTTAVFFISYYYLVNFSNKRLVNLVSLLILPYTYIISTGNYPNSLINFFNTHSDKFQFIKASDLALGVIVVLLFINKNLTDERIKILYSFSTIAVFTPVMLFNSRGSILALIVFSIYFLYYEYKIIFKNKIFTITVTILSVLLFLASTYRVYGNFDFYKEPESVQVENISQAVKGIVKNKDTAKVFLSFYIQDGYLMSWDATTDWRLDIWQDVFYDLKDKKKLIIGYGYKEIIPIMLDPTAPGRLGRDGLNENVHNYFVNILARGGLLQLGLFLIFYTYLIKHYRIKHGNYKILSLLIPVLILSSLDVTMEGVHFPFIFFSYLGYLSREGI